MRRLLRDRRTFAVALVMLVLACIVVGTLRDEGGDDGSDTSSGGPSVVVSPDGTPSGSATPDGEDDASDQGSAFPTAVAPSRASTDEASGLPVVPLADLPPEAAETVELIGAGGPFPYADDGETFLNSAGLLPEREAGYYSVYTVETPGSVEPTARRIVSGTDGELYWTDDLYDSFRRIEE